ncbi:MAG: hypothetical protein Q4C60_11795 [Eubacteriales bacterium]|nr:hypothetical protein [Eubacteriales bacterium]
MLNELYALAQTLEKQDMLEEEDIHRDVHRAGKSECLYVLLNAEGIPVRIRVLEKEETKQLWLHSKGNHCRFPAIRVQTPLLTEQVQNAFSEEAWERADLQEKRDQIGALDEEAVRPDNKDIQIRPWSLEQLGEVLKESGDAELEALRRLISRFPREGDFRFYTAFCQLLKREAASAGETELMLIKSLLVGKREGKTGKRVASCLCYFDIDELREVENPVASPETERALIEALQKAQNRQKEQENKDWENAEGISALSGTRVELIRDKYPNPTWPLLGAVYLFSNNSGASPCLSRYGMQGTAMFSAGEAQVQQMCRAIAFLTQEDRKRKTWNQFWGTAGKHPMLLLAWLEDDPKCEAKLACAVGDTGGTAVYENICRQAMDILEKHSEKSPDAPVHMQLFETLDPGRKQIAYSRRMTVGQLLRDMTAWNNGVRNLPPMGMTVFWKNRNGERVSYWKPYSPGIGAFHILLRTKYRSAWGSGAGRLQDCLGCAITVQETYQIFLPGTYEAEGAAMRRLVHKCLHQTMEIGSDLLMDMGRLRPHDYARPHPFQEEPMRRAFTAVSMMGILLYKLGIYREDYMKTKMFLLGRMLHLADRLHKNYCIIVRNQETLQNYHKSLPPQLAGSSLYRLAEKHPAQAMGDYMGRIQIYKDWAKAEPQSRSNWILSLMGETMAQMAQAEEGWPVKVSDIDRAELAIGYLANLPGKESGTAGSSPEGEAEAEKEGRQSGAEEGRQTKAKEAGRQPEAEENGTVDKEADKE